MNTRFLLRCLVALTLVAAWGVQAAETDAAPQVAGHVAFVNGQVTLVNGKQAARTVQTGDPVYVGDHIQTLADSHLHLRMVDNAFVALRPQSQLTISAYDFDKDQPQASRIRIDLQQGTSRAVSGKGGQAAKHQYRFNTPLAAIGLRGTDYTVATDSDKTRVSVAQGAVIVTPLGAGCVLNQLGPCMTPQARELTAGMPNAFIEVTPNQAPRLLNGSIAQGSRADSTAAAVTTPVTTTAQAGANADDPVKRAVLQQLAAKAEEVSRQMAVVQAPDAPVNAQEHASIARWGRWSSLVQQLPAGGGSINAVFPLMQDFQIVTANSAMALAYPGNATFGLPGQGRVQFSMVAAEAYVKDPASNLFSRAGVKSGSLEMDFAQSTFNTQLTVVAQPSQIETVQAQGTFDSYGRMKSTAATSNANVNGIVLNKGLEATYLFEKTLATGNLLSGAAQWAR